MKWKMWERRGFLKVFQNARYGNGWPMPDAEEDEERAPAYFTLEPKDR